MLTPILHTQNEEDQLLTEAQIRDLFLEFQFQGWTFSKGNAIEIESIIFHQFCLNIEEHMSILPQFSSSFTQYDEKILNKIANPFKKTF